LLVDLANLPQKNRFTPNAYSQSAQQEPAGTNFI
jgi:hypothetical protein